jgi:hypothetical protein
MNILMLLACHFVGDFGLQTKWMADFKGKSWEVNFYHAAVYTAIFVLFTELSLLATIVLLVSHFVIDALKARYGLIKHLWTDQLLHFGILLLIFFLSF